jgi:hypothetical protein
MKDEKLEAIREKDRVIRPGLYLDQDERDRRALLRYVDALRAELASVTATMLAIREQRDGYSTELADARDVLCECLPYINESMAGRRPGRSADDIRAAVKSLTARLRNILG